jgi:hypothetical protein
MSDLPADTLTTTIANVLATHALVRDTYSPLCACGAWRDKRDHDRSGHRAHVAAAVVSVLATHNEQALTVVNEAIAYVRRNPYMGNAGHGADYIASRLAAVSPTPPTHKEPS